MRFMGGITSEDALGRDRHISKEEVDDMPIYFCKACGSLKIMCDVCDEDSEDHSDRGIMWCEKCGSMDIGEEKNIGVYLEKWKTNVS